MTPITTRGVHLIIPVIWIPAIPAGMTAILYQDQAGFTCAGGVNGITTVYGWADFSQTVGVLTAKVILAGANPFDTYTIWVNQDPGDCPSGPNAPTIVTDVSGDGSVSEAVVGGATVVWVSAVGQSGVDQWLLRSTAVPMPAP